MEVDAGGCVVVDGWFGGWVVSGGCEVCGVCVIRKV
jgi:hypothetical protein